MLENIFIKHWNEIVVVLMALVGSFIGEFYRIAFSRKKETNKQIFATFFMNWALSTIIGFLLKENLKSPLLSYIATMGVGLMGVKFSEKIVKNFLGKLVSENNKKEGD